MVAYSGKEGPGRMISMKKDREKKDSQSRPLTARQEKFVQGLIAGKSQREAYREAYGCEGKKDATVDASASRLISNAKVARRFNELHQTATAGAVMSAVEMRQFIVSRLQDIASGKVCDETTIYDGKGNLKMKKRVTKQADIQNAMGELAKWYGIQPELSTSAEVTVQFKGDADGYGD